MGQGTANVCYQVGDLVVELLWVVDDEELDGPVPATVALGPRVRREPETCPLGVALTPGPLPFPAFAWAPTFLPEGLTLDVAADSTDPAQPLVFIAPGSAHTPSTSEAAAPALTVLAPAGRETPLLLGLRSAGVVDLDLTAERWAFAIRTDTGVIVI